MARYIIFLSSVVVILKMNVFLEANLRFLSKYTIMITNDQILTFFAGFISTNVTIATIIIFFCF